MTDVRFAGLAGLLDLPDDPQAMVVLLHGFTGWKEEEHLSTLARALNDVGIGTLRYDAPGSGESDGTFADNYRLTNYIASVDDALEFVREQVNPRITGVWGHSMGGFVALHTANKFAAACGSQPSHGGGNVQREQLGPWRETGWTTFSNRRFPKIELPYEFYEDRQLYNILDTIGEVRVPLMLIAGTRDEDVPASSVREIYDAAPHPKAYEEFNVNHYYKLAPAPLRRINEITVDFFTTYL